MHPASLDLVRFRRCAAGTLIAAMALATWACTPSPERQAWEAAQTTHTVEAYDAFIDAFPESRYAARASARVEALDWARTQQEDTAEAYAAFIERHAGGVNAFIASDRLRERAWEDAVADGSPEALRAHLERWPSQRREAQAEFILARQELEILLVRYAELLEQARSAPGWDPTPLSAFPEASIAQRNLIASMERAHRVLDRLWTRIGHRTEELRAPDSPLRIEVEAVLAEFAFFIELADVAAGGADEPALLALRAMLEREDDPNARAQIEAELDRVIASWADVAELEALLELYPDARAPEIRAAIARLEPRDFFDLVARDEVLATARGVDVSSVSVRLTNGSGVPLVIRTPAGMLFAAEDETVQDMIATEDGLIALRPSESATVLFSAACLNIGRRIPDVDDRFSIEPEHADAEIARMAVRLDGEAAPTRQAAIWILTADATYSRLGILVRGQSRVILPEHVERAVALLAEAGADVQAMRICRSDGWERAACSQ